MTLAEERREIELQRRTLDREKREFFIMVENEERRLKQQQDLFDTKFRILEEELIKLAAEREEIEKKKAFYDMVDDFHAKAYRELDESRVVSGELFFRGVGNRQSLKKRYKDLIKIYHPDNVDGDNSTVLEINKEYDYLCQVLG